MRFSLASMSQQIRVFLITPYVPLPYCPWMGPICHILLYVFFSNKMGIQLFFTSPILGFGLAEKLKFFLKFENIFSHLT